MFSIILPTFNNLEYLQLCLDSLEKNSKFKHEIIIHINEGTDGTLDYVIKKKLKSLKKLKFLKLQKKK